MADNKPKEIEKEWKLVEQEEMKEEHQIELKENYEQDETSEEFKESL